MIIYDKEHYIYEKRDKIREYIIILLLIKSVYTLITNYNNIHKITIPVPIDTMYSIITIGLSLAILNTASEIKSYARRKDINLKKIKYLKTYDKLLLYLYMTTSIGNIIFILYKKKSTANDIARLFFNIFFLFSIFYYYNFLF